MELNDIVANSNRAAGFAGELYVIKKEDIQTFPTLVADSYLSDAPYVPVTGKGFKKIPVSTVQGKATLVQEIVGDRDNPSRTETLNAFHAGSDPKTSHDLEAFNGAECIVLWREKSNCNAAGNPIYQVVGSACDGILLAVRFENNAPSKGYYITGEAEGAKLPLYYDQAVPV